MDDSSLYTSEITLEHALPKCPLSLLSPAPNAVTVFGAGPNASVLVASRQELFGQTIPQQPVAHSTVTTASAINSARQALYDTRSIPQQIDMYQKYLRMLPPVGDGSMATPTTYIWDEKVASQDVRLERALCLSNLATLTMKLADTQSDAPTIQRRTYYDAAGLWQVAHGMTAQLTAANAYDVDKHWPCEATRNYTRFMCDLSLSLGQIDRVLECQAMVEPVEVADKINKTFIVGQALHMARKSLIATTKSHTTFRQHDSEHHKEQDLFVTTLAAGVHAQFYAHWGLFHLYPEDQGGRLSSACALRVGTTIALLDKATAHIDAAQEKLTHTHKLHNKVLTLITTKQLARPTVAACETWLEAVNTRIQIPRGKIVDRNSRIYSEAIPTLENVHLSHLMTGECAAAELSTGEGAVGGDNVHYAKLRGVPTDQDSTLTHGVAAPVAATAASVMAVSPVVAAPHPMSVYPQTTTDPLTTYRAGLSQQMQQVCAAHNQHRGSLSALVNKHLDGIESCMSLIVPHGDIELLHRIEVCIAQEAMPFYTQHALKQQHHPMY